VDSAADQGPPPSRRLLLDSPGIGGLYTRWLLDSRCDFGTGIGMGRERNEREERLEMRSRLDVLLC
jgi:hypothetical protein